MATYEGKLEIDLAEFWQWVDKYVPNQGHEYAFGVPVCNQDNQTMDITFAASNECDPRDWAEKPASIQEWDNPRRNELERLEDAVEVVLQFFGVDSGMADEDEYEKVLLRALAATKAGNE